MYVHTHTHTHIYIYIYIYIYIWNCEEKKKYIYIYIWILKKISFDFDEHYLKEHNAHKYLNKQKHPFFQILDKLDIQQNESKSLVKIFLPQTW